MTSSAQRHVLALIASLVVGCEDDELPPLPPPTMTTGVTNAVAVGGGEVDGDTSATTATTDATGTATTTTTGTTSTGDTEGTTTGETFGTLTFGTLGTTP